MGIRLTEAVFDERFFPPVLNTGYMKRLLPCAFRVVVLFRDISPDSGGAMQFW